MHGGGGGSGGRNVEQYLMGQLEQRDKEILELKRQVVRMQCTIIDLQDRLRVQAVAAPGANRTALPQILLEGVGGQGGSLVNNAGLPPSTLVAHPSASPISSAESTFSERGSAPATPDHLPGQDSFKITVVSPSPPNERISSSQFLVILLSHSHIAERVMSYIGNCYSFMRSCTSLGAPVFQHCVVALQRFKAWHALEAGIPNESAYEILDGALSQRKKALYPKCQTATVLTHAFACSRLDGVFNTIAFNVNNPAACFREGPAGMRAENNRAVFARGLNVAVVSTLHSSTSPMDYTRQFRWMQSRRIRLVYPRAAVPHMLGMLESIKKLSIQPMALVIDVCLLKPKWFPAIEFIREYPNIILVPEIPSKEALDEGEAQHIREKFNRYLQSFATGGQCIYVVLDRSIAPEVSKEIRTSKVNVLSLPLPEREGPTGLKEYPQLELLTVLDSVFDDEFTLTVPEEREPLAPNATAFNPAPGAGGVYKYSEAQAFSFIPPGRRRRTPTSLADDDEGISDSSSYSVSSVSSVGSGGRRGCDALFKPVSLKGRSRGIPRGRQERKVLPRIGGSLLGGDGGVVPSGVAAGGAGVPSAAAEGSTTKKIAEEGGFTLSVTMGSEPEPSQQPLGEGVVLQLPVDSGAACPTAPPSRASQPTRSLVLLDNIMMNAKYRVDAAFLEEAQMQEGTRLMDRQACMSLLGRIDAADAPAEHAGAGTGLISGRVAQYVQSSLPQGAQQRPAPDVRYWGVSPDDDVLKKASSEGLILQTIPDGLTSICLCCVGQDDGGYFIRLVSACSEGTSEASFGRAVQAGNLVHLDTLFLAMPKADLTAMVQRCEAEGKQLCLCVDVEHLQVAELLAKFTEILPYVSLLFGGREELAFFAEQFSWVADSMRDLVRKAQKCIKPTGTFLLLEENLSVLAASPSGFHMNPFPTTSCDLSTGKNLEAVFIGGFLGKYCQGKEVDACIKTGFRQVVASLRPDYPTSSV